SSPPPDGRGPRGRSRPAINDPPHFLARAYCPCVRTGSAGSAGVPTPTLAARPRAPARHRWGPRSHRRTGRSTRKRMTPEALEHEQCPGRLVSAADRLPVIEIPTAITLVDYDNPPASTCPRLRPGRDGPAANGAAADFPTPRREAIVCSKRKRVPAPLLLCSHTENEAKGERGPSCGCCPAASYSPTPSPGQYHRR